MFAPTSCAWQLSCAISFLHAHIKGARGHWTSWEVMKQTHLPQHPGFFCLLEIKGYPMSLKPFGTIRCLSWSPCSGVGSMELGVTGQALGSWPHTDTDLLQWVLVVHPLLQLRFPAALLYVRDFLGGKGDKPRKLGSCPHGVCGLRGQLAGHTAGISATL